MTHMSRRTVIRGSLGLAAAGALARPYISNAEAKTATVWQVQGFVHQEDEAFRATVADYEKKSGNKIKYSIMPFMALNQKAISALTSGQVPDLIFHDAPQTILPQNAWNDRLRDVSNIVDKQKDKLSATALACSSFYNKATNKRSFYLCPVKQACVPFHIWGDLVEKAGFKLSDAPDTWNAFWDFFKPMQKELRAKGMRRIHALGLQVTTVGPNDPNNTYIGFMLANGVAGMVTEDGKLHTDNPQIRHAALESTSYLAKTYKEGYIPPEALSWNDADDNNAFHEKRFIVDFDGTLSTELAMIAHPKEFHAAVTKGLPKGNDGKPMPAQLGAGGGFIPKGAKNYEVSEDFMTYFMTPEVMNKNLQGGLGRWVPVIPSIVKDDPFWLHNKTDPHLKPYVEEAVLGPTVPNYYGYNPAWGQVAAEQLLMQTVADVVKNNMKVEEAVDKAFKRADTIWTKYTFG